MKKNIIKETIANVVSNSKVLKDFIDNPKPMKDYADKLVERSSPGYVEEFNLSKIDERTKGECSCSNCMFCLGLSWRDFI